MDESPLAKLSGELRNQIYELVLYEPTGIPLYAGPFKTRPTDYELMVRHLNKPATPPNNPLRGLPQTCKAIRHETLLLCFALNKVTIYAKILDANHKVNLTRYYTSTLARWARLVGRQQCAQVKDVVFDCGTATNMIEYEKEKYFGSSPYVGLLRDDNFEDHGSREMTASLSEHLGLDIDIIKRARWHRFDEVDKFKVLDWDLLYPRLESYFPSLQAFDIKFHVTVISNSSTRPEELLIHNKHWNWAWGSDTDAFLRLIESFFSTLENLSYPMNRYVQRLSDHVEMENSVYDFLADIYTYT
ncbi:Hypothetical predicted protein [Lecanosticta acicola]|uniref:Uncharacterized protein n=1 Tax=Lecanosticta acicola TaxID=111012 RepID=A0AAI8Z5Y1_9PEZI|nr:Hypothetical predicted protein [Lecanosticta acicola]